LFSYKLPGCAATDQVAVDQIALALEKLQKAPYTRRAQAVTWQAWRYPHSEHPPCLQRLWFRVVNGKLVMHAHMRCNDALKAAFMNMFAFTELQRGLAERLKVAAGRYVHFADSYHVYERDWKWFNSFVQQARSGESRRPWKTADEFAKMTSASSWRESIGSDLLKGTYV